MRYEYRVLTEADALDYKRIRLELLKNHPTNFGSSYEEELVFPVERFETRIKNPNATTFGVYDNEEIIGICVIVRNPRSKMKHRVTLNSMYIKGEYRRQGVGVELLRNVFNYLMKTDVEMISLTVVTDNEPAIKLYQTLGFLEDGIEKRAIKVDGEYYDLLLMHKELKKETS